jgi:hypothetical protein
VSRRRLAVGAAVVVVLALALGVGLVLVRRHAGPLATARELTAEDSGWDGAAHAAETLASLGEDLLREGKACGHGPHCDDILSASAWAQVSAVLILRCTRPAVFQTRTDARALVTTLAHSPHERPTLPPTPTC